MRARFRAEHGDAAASSAYRRTVTRPSGAPDPAAGRRVLRH